MQHVASVSGSLDGMIVEFATGAFGEPSYHVAEFVAIPVAPTGERALPAELTYLASGEHLQGIGAWLPRSEVFIGNATISGRVE